MDINKERTIYLVSGPSGVGKSTTSRKLAEGIERSAYIEGDLIDHMVVGGYLPPWESPELVGLIWENITSMSHHYIDADMDVVIDYVIFPDDANKFSKMIRGYHENVNIVYVVLLADKKELLERDALRKPENQMGERCVILVDEFMDSGLDDRFIYNTGGMGTDSLLDIISNIKTNPRFRL